MRKAVEETNLCWRLHYSDEVAVPIDALPCVPEDQSVINAVRSSGVARKLPVAITDRRHPNYQIECSNFFWYRQIRAGLERLPSLLGWAQPAPEISRIFPISIDSVSIDLTAVQAEEFGARRYGVAPRQERPGQIGDFHG